MELLLYILREYGLFIGIVVGTIVLIWGTYAIYNAIVRAKANQVHITPIVAKTPAKTNNDNASLQKEETPTTVEIKSPSLEGEGVIKTGPRKMSFSDDSNEILPVQLPKQEPKPIVENPKDFQNETIKTMTEKPVETKIEPSKQTINSSIQPLHKSREDDMVPAEETLMKKTLTPPLQPSQRRIVLPKDDDEVVNNKPKPKAKVVKVVAEKKVEPTKPYAEQKGIIVQKPKPKKKVPPKYHVFYRATDDSWYVKVEGNDAIIGTLETQREAISFATIKALKSDTVVIVHRKDGKIRKQATMKDVTDSEEEE
jgi:hypothetical protein